jgi:HemY protein
MALSAQSYQTVGGANVMMRLLLIGALAIVGAWLAAWALSAQGYVAVQFGGWLVETSVSALALGLLIVAGIGYGATRLLVGVWQSPKRFLAWRNNKRLRLPVQRLNAGIHALALSDDHAAVLKLTQGKDDSQWLRMMLAAQLAQAQGKIAQRNQYVAQALNLAPDEAFTIRLLQARWLMNDDTAQALAIVEDMLAAHPRQRTLKALRVQALAKLAQWQRLAEVLPSAKSALSRASYLQLQGQQLVAQLTHCVDRQQLDDIWHMLPSRQQRQSSVAAAYVSRALAWGQSQQFWQILSKSLNTHWDASLHPLLAQVAGSEPYSELKQVQHWQQQHPNDAGLWWLSGILANKLGIVGQAEKDWQHSLALAPTVPAALALSELYASQAKGDVARQLLTQQLQTQQA